jgi:hypothetical protein
VVEWVDRWGCTQNHKIRIFKPQDIIHDACGVHVLIDPPAIFLLTIMQISEYRDVELIVGVEPEEWLLCSF